MALLGGLVALILVVGVTASLIVLTPIREFIPGYPNAQIRNTIVNNALRADSLERVIHLWEVHLVNLQRVLANKEPMAPDEMLPRGQLLDAPAFVAGDKSEADSLLRVSAQEQDNQTKGDISGRLLLIEGLHFFPPIKGVVTAEFNPLENHYAIDIVAPKNTLISAVLDGTVNFASWTEEFGYVLQIQHENNLLSIYKHCSKLFKKVGDSVTAGSAIAVIGSEGTFSTGPHLHFELWHKGVALNPMDYINF